METINFKGYNINIQHDELAENPREWDNLGTIAYKHRDYTLGDEVIKDTIQEHFNNKYDILEPSEYYLTDTEIQKIDKWIKKNIIMLPVYLYDHSGITINTTGFSCQWDSGQVGIIYVSKEHVKNEYGWKTLTKFRQFKIENQLRNEIKTFGDYLTGNCYYYTIEDDNGNTLDSCGGFYGYEHKKSGLLYDAQKLIDYYIKEYHKKRELEFNSFCKVLSCVY